MIADSFGALTLLSDRLGFEPMKLCYLSPKCSVSQQIEEENQKGTGLAIQPIFTGKTAICCVCWQ